jgi:hypothetical protein
MDRQPSIGLPVIESCRDGRIFSGIDSEIHYRQYDGEIHTRLYKQLPRDNVWIGAWHNALGTIAVATHWIPKRSVGLPACATPDGSPAAQRFGYVLDKLIEASRR